LENKNLKTIWEKTFRSKSSIAKKLEAKILDQTWETKILNITFGEQKIKRKKF